MYLYLIVLMISMVSGQADPKSRMQELLPPSAGEWKIAGESGFYSGEEIFDYMDGAGEIYRAYKFKNLLVGRYISAGGEEILAELFDMGSSSSAFGVFTYMQGRGPGVKTGSGAEYKNGLLCFWKGNYFACISTERENENLTNGILLLGRLISEKIPSGGEKPDMLRYLPEGIFTDKSLRYFYGYEMLNIHYYVAEKNILNLNDKTEGVLAATAGDGGRILIVRYPAQEEADTAYRSFIQNFMPQESGNGIVKRQNKKWTACIKQKNFLVVVFDASTRERAAEHIQKVRSKLP